MMISLVCVHTSLSITKEFSSFVLQSQIKSLFQHICHCMCQPRRRNMWSLMPKPVERENAIPSWANRWRWLISHPLALRARSLQKKDIRDNVGGRECQKGKEKRTKVCWCVKADKVGSSVATFSYLMADLSKCIESLLGSVAAWLREKLHKDSPVDMVSPHSISAPLILLLYLD